MPKTPPASNPATRLACIEIRERLSFRFMLRASPGKQRTSLRIDGASPIGRQVQDGSTPIVRLLEAPFIPLRPAGAESGSLKRKNKMLRESRCDDCGAARRRGGLLLWLMRRQRGETR